MITNAYVFVKESKKGIFIAMEMCDYDLDKLIKGSPLQEEEVISFMHELGKVWHELRT